MMHAVLVWQSWLTAAIVAVSLSLAVEARAESAEPTGFVVSSEQAAELAGGEPLNVLAETLIHEVVAALSRELVGKDTSTNHSIGVWRYSLPPYSGPMTRAHRDADQFLYVVEGRVEFVIGDRKWLANAGSLAFIPRQTPHDFTNMADESAILIGGVLPEGSAKLFARRK